jgi:iron complex outermembrane recepter protein
LLILDNCEHVIDAAAGFVERIVKETAQVDIAPRWTANASLELEHRMTAGIVVHAGIDYTFQSSRVSTVAAGSPVYYVIGSSGLTDLHVSADLGHVTTSLRIDNLCNRFDPQSAKALDSNLIETITAARPRALWLSAAAHIF